MRHVANYEANKLKKKKWFNTKKEVRYEIWLLFLLLISGSSANSVDEISRYPTKNRLVVGAARPIRAWHC